jgi:glycosyltransferase involved in cell wall biosynthesis
MSINIQEKQVYLITGNTRIGGAQRIALDEFYELSNRGIQVKLVSLNPIIENDDILNVDKHFPPAKDVSIISPGSGKIKQLKYFIQEFAENPNKIHVVSHDFSGVLISRCAALAIRKRITVDLYIHQLMDLSDSRQRQKRIFLSLFATNVYVSSFQFKRSWEDYLKNSRLWRILYWKKIHFDRMGVHVPRILNTAYTKTKVCDFSVPHIIFMSRITAWKGFSVYSEFIKKFVNNSVHSLILTTKNGRPEIFNENLFIDELNHVVYESGVSNLELPRGSVHLYPTNYGQGVAYPQSIGMNVLELLAVGIPSVISPEGFQSWPELESSVMISTNDWSDEADLESHVSRLCNLTEIELKAEVERLLPVISISNHIDRVVGRMTK